MKSKFKVGDKIIYFKKHPRYYTFPVGTKCKIENKFNTPHDFFDCITDDGRQFGLDSGTEDYFKLIKIKWSEKFK